MPSQVRVCREDLLWVVADLGRESVSAEQPRSIEDAVSEAGPSSGSQRAPPLETKDAEVQTDGREMGLGRSKYMLPFV